MSHPEPKAEPATAPKPKRRSRWRWPKRFVKAFLLLLVAGLIVYGIVWKVNRFTGQRRLDVVMARLDAEEPGWRFEDIVAEHNSKLPPDESNSAVRAVMITKGFPPRSNTFPSLDNLYERVADGREPNELPPADCWAELEEKYPGYDNGIAELRQWNASTPRGRVKMELERYDGRDFPLGCSLHFNTTGFALTWDALRAAHSKDPDRAIGSAIAALHLIRSIDVEPTHIGLLVRMGRAQSAANSVEQTLAWCPDPNEASLLTMQQLLGKENSAISIRAALRWERAYAIHRLELFDRGESYIVDQNPKPAERIGLKHFVQFVPDSIVYIDERFREISALNDLPPERKAAAIKGWKLPPREFNMVIARDAMPGAHKLLIAELQHRAKCLSAEAGIACERFRLKKERWPTSFAELKEFGIPKAPIDPCSGQPLLFRSTEQGLSIYSVGEDGADDGGDLRPSPANEGKPKDVGFRLWNPERRRIHIPEVKPDDVPLPE